jgi:hypothetical protein
MIWFGWKALDVDFMGRGIQTNCFCTIAFQTEVVRLYFGKHRRICNYDPPQETTVESWKIRETGRKPDSVALCCEVCREE